MIQERQRLEQIDRRRRLGQHLATELATVNHQSHARFRWPIIAESECRW
jgi:hypothetical protein